MAHSINPKLKAFVRVDGTGRVISGTPVLQASKPKVGNWIEIPAYLEPASTTTTTSTSTSTTTTTSTSTSTTTTTTTAAPVYAIYAASPSQSEVCSGQGVGINTGIPSGSTLANTSIIYADFLTAGYFGGQTTFYRFDDGGTPYTREFYINMSVTSADPMGPAVPC